MYKDDTLNIFQYAGVQLHTESCPALVQDKTNIFITIINHITNMILT